MAAPPIRRTANNSSLGAPRYCKSLQAGALSPTTSKWHPWKALIMTHLRRRICCSGANRLSPYTRLRSERQTTRGKPGQQIVIWVDSRCHTA